MSSHRVPDYDLECEVCGVPSDMWIYRDPLNPLRWRLREEGDKSPFHPFIIEFSRVYKTRNLCRGCMTKHRHSRDPK